VARALFSPTGAEERTAVNNFRNLALWIIIALILVALLHVFQGPNQRQGRSSLSYTEFNQQVVSDSVKDVNISGRHIEGQMKNGAQFTTEIPENDSGITDRMVQHNVNVRVRPEGDNITLLSIFLNWFPMLFLFAVMIYVMRQMQAGGGKAMGFGKSRAKMLTERQGRVTFEDVAGVDEAKEDLVEIVDFLKDPQKFQKLGGRIPKGVLLIGSPGTGKTLLARAIAGEASVPFFSISGSDFVEMFVGVGASRVRDLFVQGKKHAPCIIFIDEIDAVGRHRGAGLGGGHDEREQTLNQLLVEMDGFEANEGVILVAATNRPDVLDPALLRPGRFDRRVVVPRPDVRGREGILRVHTRKVPLSDDVDVFKLARSTSGFAGADIENLVNEAALLAARRNKEKVEMTDFELAKDKVLMGAERKSMVMKDEERKLTAYHEGGHAICAIKVKGNDPLHKVTIVPRGRTLGVAWTLPEDDRVSVTREQLEANLVKAYGGRVAEELVFGRDRVTTGAASDIQQATGLARRYVSQWGLSDEIGPVLVGDNEQELFLGRELQTRREVSERTAQLVDSEVTRVIKEAYARATVVLQENMELLHTVAAALLDRETLTGDEVAILSRGEKLPPRPISPPPTAPALATPVMHPKASKPPLFGGPEVAPA